MAKDTIPEYDTSPGNNTDIDGVDISEGCAPSTINNAIRELMADQANAIQVRQISSATTLSLSDHGKLIRCNAASASFAVTLPAASTSTGMTVAIHKADGTSNTVNVDGNSSETIDSGGSFRLEAKHDAIVIRCNGSNWYTLSRSIAPLRFVYTSDTTHNIRSGRTRVLVEVQGAGGGGGGTEATAGSENACAGGGGGGGYTATLLGVTAVTSATITVGSGGAGAVAGNNAGAAGGNSSWDDGTNTVTGNGGSGGNGGAATSTSSNSIVLGGAGGSASGGDYVSEGGAGGKGTVANRTIASGKGGGTFFGAGPESDVDQAGNAATTPGSGGSGASSNASNSARAGGNGADGIVIVTEYA
jgi:hypothetical protein